VRFEYIDPDAIHELPGERIGIVAQDVEGVFPDWVQTGADGYKRITCRGFEALTVEALRDLRAEKDLDKESLQRQVAALRADAAAKEAQISDLKERLTRLEAVMLPARPGEQPRR
jgi:hypothetical protein